MRSLAIAIVLAALAAMLLGRSLGAPAPEPASGDPVVWFDEPTPGEPRTHVHFFYTETCPHCRDAGEILDALEAERPWLVVTRYEVRTDPEAAELYLRVAESLGEVARSVPGIAFCRRLVQGNPGREFLAQAIDACRPAPSQSPTLDRTAARGPPERLDLPGLRGVDLERLSLPVTTIVLAGLDAFNPCAFFVLLFLLSMLVRTGDRRRMLAIAGVFIAMSGLFYFAFMAAWLNVFLWIGELRGVTLVAGVVAIAMGSLDLKDVVRPGGVSRSIPEKAKPSLFRRMRALVRAESLATALLATIVLAAAANSYELLCTAGFPLVYTRLLTLADLSPAAHYSYLALYNLVYVLPLVVIVVLFVKTLGTRKLQAHEGRALKLLSGTMMVELGVVLVVAPQWLARLGTAVALVLVALAVAILARWIERRAATRPTRAPEMPAG